MDVILQVEPVTMHRLKVQHGEEFLIYLNKKTYTCNEFTIDELRYCHIVAIFRNHGYSVYAYCSYFYTREAYKSTYEEAENPRIP